MALYLLWNVSPVVGILFVCMFFQCLLNRCVIGETGERMLTGEAIAGSEEGANKAVGCYSREPWHFGGVAGDMMVRMS